MPKLLFKGVSVDFEAVGSGPAVVLIHGFLEAKWMWTSLLPHLPKARKYIMVDLPGHGASECISYLHTMEEMAEVIHELCKKLRVRKCTLVGHSMGGYVALAFAELYPDMVRTLVLYQSTALDDQPAKKADRLRALELVKGDHRSFVRKSIPMLFRPINRKRFRRELHELKTKALITSKQGIIAALAGMRDRPNREILLKFPPYPVHIIASDKDPRIPLEEAEYLASISDSVHLHKLKGCGHMSYIESPAQVVESLKKVL